MFIFILCFFFLSCVSSLYILDINPCRHMVHKYSLSIHRLSFHCVDYSFFCAEIFWFDAVSLIYFCFSFRKLSKKANVNESHPLPMFSFRIFTVSDFTFSSLIHFQLIFVYGVMWRCTSLACGCRIFPISLIKVIIHFLLCLLVALVENYLTIYTCAYS
jgi:hypothetical protein